MPKNASQSERSYDRVIKEIFNRLYKPSETRLEFTREELEQAAIDLDIKIKNLGDVPYTYHSRAELPRDILAKGNWIIEGTGKGRYAFRLLQRPAQIDIPRDLEITPILDSTPEVIRVYGGEDEQGLLTRIRYNRLVDVFLGLTAYHLQGHFRNFVKGIGQVEIDDLYLGVDTNGQWYCIPIEAKSSKPSDMLGVVQIGSLIAFARQNYSDLPMRPVAAKEWPDQTIYLVEFNDADDLEDIRSVRYKRYRLYHEDHGKEK